MGRGVVGGACLLSLVVIGALTVSHAAEPAAPTPAVQSMPQPANGNAFCRILSANPLDRGALLLVHHRHHRCRLRSPQYRVLSRPRQPVI